jgi:hypothetical protein
MNSEYREGVIVEAVSKPEWGPGKIVHINGDHLHVFFRDIEGKEAKVFKATRCWTTFRLSSRKMGTGSFNSCESRL